MNFNAKVFADLSKIEAWSDQTGIIPKVFDSYDGGGWTGYIVEFASKADLYLFCRSFSAGGRLWAEDAEGNHLSLERPSREKPPTTDNKPPG